MIFRRRVVSTLYELDLHRGRESPRNHGYIVSSLSGPLSYERVAETCEYHRINVDAWQNRIVRWSVECSKAMCRTSLNLKLVMFALIDARKRV
jgi:hypothetical protein